MLGIPKGFHSITPYLVVRDAASAIDFYKRAFGATELLRMQRHNGLIIHAEIKIGDSPLMVVDETSDFPDMMGIQSLGNSPIHIHLYTENVDALMAQALAAGAEQLMPLKDTEEGERRGGVKDPFGFTWWLSQQIKEISREEMQRLYDAKAKA